VNILNGNTVLVPVDGLSVEEFDDGAVIWQPQGQRLHLLDVPGRELWRRLGQDSELAEVFAETGSDFGADADVIRRDAMPFLADLVAKGLLIEV
jgi:hypothetical protein